jgi:cytochrome P450
VRLGQVSHAGTNQKVSNNNGPCMCAQVPVYAIHHDPEIYTDPEVFKPERWLEGTPEYAADKHMAGKWMPFGEGTRVCVGQRLALIEAKIALAHVFRK